MANPNSGIDPIVPIVLVAAVIGAILAIVLGRIKNKSPSSQPSECSAVTGRGGAVEAKAHPIHATTIRTAYTIIMTGTIIAHSLTVLPKKTASSGAKKSNQK